MSDKNINLKNVIEGLIQNQVNQKKSSTKTTQESQQQEPSEQNPQNPQNPQNNKTNPNHSLSSMLSAQLGAILLDPSMLKKLIQALPSETIDKISHRVDGIKNEGLELVRNELQRLIAKIDIQSELEKLLSKFIVEIHTEIRFVPSENGSIKPKVNAKANLKVDEEQNHLSNEPSPQENNTVKPSKNKKSSLSLLCVCV